MGTKNINLSAIYMLYAFSIPFVTIGVRFGPQWWVTPSLLLGVVISAITLIKGRYYLFSIFYFCLLVYILLNVKYTSSISSQGLSVLAFAASSSVIISVGHITRFGFERFCKGYIYSFNIVFFMVFIDLFFQALGLYELSDMVSIGIVDGYNRWGGYNTFGIFTRPHGPFVEPSQLGFYAFVSYVFFSTLDSMFSASLKKLAIFLVIMSMSMTGILSLLGYKLIDALYIKRNNIFSFNRPSFFVVLRMALVVSMVWFIFNNIFTDVVDKLFNRIEVVFTVLSNFTLFGSAGSRLHGGLTAISMFLQEDVVTVIWGLGWGLQPYWLESIFSYLGEKSPLSSGNLYDKISLLIITLGLIGLFLFVSIMVLYYKVIKSKRPILFMFIIIAWLFSSGQLTGYLDWQLLLVIGLGYLFRDHYGRWPHKSEQVNPQTSQALCRRAPAAIASSSSSIVI